MTFTKPFKGVPNGQFYPVEYQVGDACPPELHDAAEILGAFDDKKTKSKAE